MRKVTPYTQIVMLVLLANLISFNDAFAQRKNLPNKPELDQRLQKLIEIRSHEHWGLYETQMLPTPPPRSQPVQALPEWYPSGGVLLTLSDDYIHSFRLNRILGTEDKEIIRPDADTINYIKIAGCNALFGIQQATSESFRRDPKVSTAFDSLCGGVPKSERRPINASGADTKNAEDWWLYLYMRLEDNLIFDDLSRAHIFLHLVKEFASRTKVVILIDGNEKAGEDALPGWIAYFKGFPLGEQLLDSNNIQFVQVPVKTKWVRDYGPIFVRSIDGQIFCLDARYNTDRVSLEDKRLQNLFESIRKNDPQKAEQKQQDDRLDDDVSPSFLAERLRQKRGRFLLPNPVNIARPPIDLAGGDFFTDGNGIGFTSTNMLQSNGGDTGLLNLVFKEYFGPNDMVYLHPLPGKTAPHIDMFFKVVSPEILLLGQFAPSNANTTGTLQTEAQRTMEQDLKVLKDFYEKRRVKVNVVSTETDEIQKNAVNIVRVPMPDLLRPARDQFENMERELVRLQQEREELSKAAEVARGIENSLAGSQQALRENYTEIENTIGKLQSSGSAKLINFSHLQEVFAQTITTVHALYDKYGTSKKSIDWQGVYQELLELSTNLENQKGRKLGSNDRQVLALRLRRSNNTLQQIISGLETFRIEIKKAYNQGTSALAQVDGVIKRTWEKRNTLLSQIPNSLDIYRTFLNALQVKTSRTNLLFVPSYSNLNAIEKRAQHILQRAYTSAYGNVTIIPINTDYFIKESGSIHCLTQTLPVELDVFADR
jgi:agmatine/peptidylarginine deiminase